LALLRALVLERQLAMFLKRKIRLSVSKMRR
jgi:hypothetical protein